MKTIAILYGGKSGEHEVSLISAASILGAIDRSKYLPIPIGIHRDGTWYLQGDLPTPAPEQPDAAGPMRGLPPVVRARRVFVAPGDGLYAETAQGGMEKLRCDAAFPVLHGTFGEDGTVQGLLECAGVPYVGAPVLGSAAGMDKHVAKELWMRENLPVVDAIAVRAEEMGRPGFLSSLERKIEARFGWPCFIKPAGSGSSVGTSKVKDMGALRAALEKAFLYDTKVLVEEFIPAREIECAVLGNENPKVFSPGEIVPTHEFYDYDAKYRDPEGALLKIPAEITTEQEAEVMDLAAKAFKTLELCGMARVDFFIDKRTGKLYLNEVNTIPGFTAISMYPRMCRAGGLSYPGLIDALLELAFRRHESRAGLKYSFDGE